MARKSRAPAFALALALGAGGLGAVAHRAFAGDEVSDDAALKEARAIEHAIVDVTSRCSPAFVVIGGGSGIVISDDGYMITNHHVAGSKPVGETWRVKLPASPFIDPKLVHEGSAIVDARVIGHDPQGDISLLKLEGKGPFPHVELGDSDALAVGDFALALGNPFGYSKDSTPTVSVGVVSAIHRFQGGYSDAIQTDAAINPGNSGGPLFNMQGQLVGINGRIAVRYGTKINTGVGYSIPSNQIKRFLADFKKQGIVHHGVVGGLAHVRDTRDGGEGAVLGAIAEGSPAAKAGLQRGDVVVELDGRPVANVARFQGILGTIPAGETVKIKVRRGDKSVETEVTLDKVQGDEADAAEQPRTNGAYLGIQMAPNEDGGGVVVAEVTKGSPAEAAGLQAGDVIVQFGRRKVTNVNALVASLGRRKPGAKVKVVVERDGKRVEVVVTLGKKESSGE